jgi:hypothetical protein
MPARERYETAAVRQRLVVLSTTLRGFANCAESYEGLHHYLPAPGSVAALEIEAGGSFATDTLSAAAMVLGGAHDHVVGLHNLLDAQSSVYAPLTVARALLEGAARAWWLLDPTIDGRERACRVLTERLASLREAIKIEHAMTGGAGQAATARINHVADLARRHSLQVLNDNRGRPVAVGAQRPSATDLVARLLVGRGSDMVFGEVAFRAWSGATHGMLWSLTTGLDPQLDPAGKHKFIAYRRMTLDAVESLTAIAAMAFGEAFNCEVEVYGWDRREWDAYVQQGLVDLRSSAPST